MHRQIAKEQVLVPTRLGELELGSASRLAQLLQSESLRVVLAESCTVGGVALALGSVPNISENLCGSAVVYRDQEKADWLGVSQVGIRQWSNVCAPVASLMAFNVLQQTPEADYAASITGHLGPHAPPQLDGVIYIGLAWRDSGEAKLFRVEKFQLMQRDRLSRLREATNAMLTKLTDCILVTHKFSNRSPRRDRNGYDQPQAI